MALAGALLLLSGKRSVQAPIAWMRSKGLAVLFFGLAVVWFLWHVWHLGEADFGRFRFWLLLVFGLAGFGAFSYCRELLAARGVCCLYLLLALPLLGAAYMHYEHPQRLLMVGGIYLLLPVAITFGAMPWRFRDTVTWLYKKPARLRWTGRLLVAYGLCVALTSLTY